MDRNLAMELARVTEAAALACGRWVGKGNKIEADRAATEAMRRTLESIDIAGTVVIGEGEMDEAPIPIEDLYRADEIFIAGTTAEVTPVTDLDGRAVGPGRPGDTSLRLLGRLRERARGG